MKLIFLDIDGVLNDHQFHPEALICALLPACVAQLGRVISQTGAKIVLSSDWRYMIHESLMSLQEFEALLRAHGAPAELEIIGVTTTDEAVKGRGQQIAAWLQTSTVPIEAYVVIDDRHEEIDSEEHAFVCTDRTLGLTERDADTLIVLLSGPADRGEPPHDQRLQT